MSTDLVTRLTLEGENDVLTVEVPGNDIEFSEFMELIELMITSSKYSKHEIESYVLDWAESIRSTKEN